MNGNEHQQLILLGVGGGGCRLVASVRTAYGEGIQALGVDTDALANFEVSKDGLTCLLLGGNRLAGRGTGGDVILGRQVAQDGLEDVLKHLQGARTVVVVACLGGGTGGGVTPEIVKELSSMGVATVCFMTQPFTFEGDVRGKAAEQVLRSLERTADSLVVVPLDDLFADARQERVEDAMREAGALVSAGITLLWRLVTKPGFIRLDAERLHALVVRCGGSRFGFGVAEGPGRAGRAVAALKACRLLQGGESFSTASAVMLGILAGRDLLLSEIGEIMDALGKLCKKDCVIEMGTVLDGAYEGRIELVAIAFDSWRAGVQVETRKGVAAEASPSIPPVGSPMPVGAGGGKRRQRPKKGDVLAATAPKRFQNVDPTFWDGANVDVPTYVRRSITLER